MVEKIKEEGRAGLLFALDTQENYVAAEDAVTGEKYLCPVCKCKMHVVTSPKGKRYFARNAGEQHTNGKCISYERSQQKHTFEGLDLEKFILGLCRVTPKKDVGDGAGSGGSGEGDSEESDDDEIKVTPFTSLKQIANEMDYLDANKVSDFLLTFRNAERALRVKSINLGARIVLCRYAAYKGESNALLFDLFCKRNGSTTLALRLCLVFPNKKDFLKYREKFGQLRPVENGTTQFVKRHKEQDVLIACDSWEYIPTPNCKGNCGKRECGKCYGMYQAVFSNAKQIYLIPADD